MGEAEGRGGGEKQREEGELMVGGQGKEVVFMGVERDRQLDVLKRWNRISLSSQLLLVRLMLFSYLSYEQQEEPACC
jgi:hypothetical protein